MRIVVCDTGPILHLREARVLELLRTAGEVIVPPAVEAELARQIPGWSTDRPAWVHIEPVPAADAEQVQRWREVANLGPGEAEAIVLARALSADWLLTDDAAARLVGSMLGLEVHGSLGVILWLAAHGHLLKPDALAALERLAKSSLWISPRILVEARRALDTLTG